jgi:hypothetical protein
MLRLFGACGAFGRALMTISISLIEEASGRHMLQSPSATEISDG